MIIWRNIVKIVFFTYTIIYQKLNNGNVWNLFQVRLYESPTQMKMKSNTRQLNKNKRICPKVDIGNWICNKKSSVRNTLLCLHASVDITMFNWFCAKSFALLTNYGIDLLFLWIIDFLHKIDKDESIVEKFNINLSIIYICYWSKYISVLIKMK